MASTNALLLAKLLGERRLTLLSLITPAFVPPSPRSAAWRDYLRIRGLIDRKQNRTPLGNAVLARVGFLPDGRMYDRREGFAWRSR